MRFLRKYAGARMGKTESIRTTPRTPDEPEPTANGSVSKRERILSAACLLFSQRDFHTVSVDDVARQADIAKGTLYNYFESKEALYLAIIETRMEHLISLLHQRLSERHDPLEDLRRFLIHLYRFMTKYPDFFIVWKKEEGTERLARKSRGRRMHDELVAMLHTILCRGVEEGVFRPVPRDLLTGLLLGIVDAAVYRTLYLSLSPQEQEKESDEIFDFVVHGLKAR